MPISDYLAELRGLVGNRLLILPGTAALIYNDEGKILAIRRADDGQWGLPAGAVDPGESAAQTIVREVKEETGLDVHPVRVAGIGGPLQITYPNGDRSEYTITFFVCEIDGGELEALDGEVLEFGWFGPDDLPPLHGDVDPGMLFGGDRARVRF